MSSKTLLHGLTKQKNKKTSKAFMQSSLREGFFETSDSEISIIIIFFYALNKKLRIPS